MGPTAVGKTAIGVRLGVKYKGEILSADSRQVYKGLDIGSGKDLADYSMDIELAMKINPSVQSLSTNGKYNIPYHIIDVTDLNSEYNLFDFQEDFYKSFIDCSSRNVLPICVGGTGMYLDSILRNYDMIPVPDNPNLYKELEQKSYDELKNILIKEKEKLHNTTEFGDKDRLIKAIIINRFNQSDEYKQLKENRPPRPIIKPLVLCTTLERNLVRQRISERLRVRLEEGLINEVENLHNSGFSWQRLESLGLEYRFVSQYLQGTIPSKEKLFELLNLAIGQFAKRQETWFRGMEKKGVKINWLPQTTDIDTRFEAAVNIIESNRYCN